MKNKIIGSLLLGAALGLGGAIVSPVSSVAFAAEGADGFSDVPKDHWAYEALDYLAKEGIIEGCGDGTFRGNRTMTRYEMASIVAKATQKGGGSLGGKAVCQLSHHKERSAGRCFLLCHGGILQRGLLLLRPLCQGSHRA